MFQTQVEIPVTTADLYFPTEPRPLVVFVDGPVHLSRGQMIKDEETRSLAKEGIQDLELFYMGYSNKKGNDLIQEIKSDLSRQ